MGQNVYIRSGAVKHIMKSITTAPVTGDWHFKDAPDAALQITVDGTGTVTATHVIECSNDAVVVAVTSTTLTVTGTAPAGGGAVITGPWKYIRTRQTAVAGTGAASTVSISS